MQSSQSAKQGSKKPTGSERIQTTYLVIVSIIALLIALASVFGPVFDFLVNIFPFLKLINLIALLLLVFSVLGIAISLERYETVGVVREKAQRRHEEVIQAIARTQSIVERDDLNLEKGIAEVHQLLTISIPSQVLMGGPNEIYRVSIELVENCKGTEIILATSLGDILHEDVESPYNQYLEALVKKIVETKQQKIGMLYRVVMGFQLNREGEPPLVNQAGIRRRRELFKKYNILDRMQIRYLETPWSLDLFIVGNEHMIIGFPSYAEHREIRLALRVTDKDFVNHVAGWYNEHLWSAAKPLTWTGEGTQS